MAKSRKTDVDEQVETETPVETSKSLVDALVSAIELTRPEQKKNPFNRKVNTPWTPKDGSKKLKLKRRMYQHGLPAEEDILSNEEIDLMNQVKPGIYCQGTIKVVRRKDRGIDLDWPCKTASQRLKLVNAFGLRTLSEILQRCIEEGKNPKLQTTAEEED